MTEWQPTRDRQDAETKKLNAARECLREAKASIRSKDQEIAALEAVIATLKAISGRVWQPIETAPKDGTPILLHCQIETDEVTLKSIMVGEWDGSRFSVTVAFDGIGMTICNYLTAPWDYWMPLPEPPK